MASNGTYRYIAYRRRRRNGKGAPRWLLVLAALGLLALVAAGIAAGVGYNIYQGYADDLVPPDEEIAKLPRGGARILDRDGRFLYEFLDDVSGLRDPVPAEEISLYLILATIATEDASFMDNPGVSFSGLANAAWDNFWPFGSTPGFLEGRGGSSITQQLVKNVYFTPEERAKRSIDRKLRETVYALELTKQYSKEQIMAWYLNQISYGSVFIGVEAASRGYFNKSASELTLAEAALLAAIPASPERYDPISNPETALQQRNEVVLKRMYDEGYITDEQFWEAAQEPLGVDLQPARVNAPHFVFNVVRPELERLFGEEALNRDGLVVYTTLDLDAQRRAQAILEEQITTYEYSGGHNGAAVGIDPKTAEILVYVGSRDYFNEEIDGQNDMAEALNSPGSSFKPFTYITAFMNLGWGPGTMIYDSPIPSQFWDAERQPRNPVGHSGPISVRNALGSSLNIPAVKTILYTGVLEVIEQAKKMGITSLDRDLGPSMTVGGVDVKLIDMVYGYTVFPNLGILKGVETTVARPEGNRELDPVSILRVEDRDGNVLYPLVDGEPVKDPKPLEVRVAPAQESYLITHILSDGCAQAITFGVCGALSLPDGRPMAIKTGTSEPYADSLAIGDTWAIGYTPQLVFGSWFGNADNSPMEHIDSTSVSWRTVRDFMTYYHEDLPVESFTAPEGLARAKVCVPSGLKPTANCPITTQEDLFAAHSLPQAKDNWWTKAKIDARTGKLASDLTPPEFVRESFYLNLPDGLSEWARIQAQEWARSLHASTQPAPTEETQESDIPSSTPIAVITSPASTAVLVGPVTITGRADSDGFVSYLLEYFPETQGGNWTLITESTSPVRDGTLGVWDTTGLPHGSYLIRLVVVDAERGRVSATVRINLAVTDGPVPTSAAPTATPGP